MLLGCLYFLTLYADRARKLQREKERKVWMYVCEYVGLHPIGLQAQLQDQRKRLESATEISMV